MEPDLKSLQQAYEHLGSQQRSRQLESQLAQLVEKWHQLMSLSSLLNDRCFKLSLAALINGQYANCVVDCLILLIAKYYLIDFIYCFLSFPLELAAVNVFYNEWKH